MDPFEEPVQFADVVSNRGMADSRRASLLRSLDRPLPPVAIHLLNVFEVDFAELYVRMMPFQGVDLTEFGMTMLGEGSGGVGCVMLANPGLVRIKCLVQRGPINMGGKQGAIGLREPLTDGITLANDTVGVRFQWRWIIAFREAFLLQ